MKQQFDLWHLNLQTSINCWQSMSARYALFASKTVFDSELFDECHKMVSEKVSLSFELVHHVTSMRCADDPVANYRKILESVNQKASSNVKRLTKNGANA